MTRKKNNNKLIIMNEKHPGIKNRRPKINKLINNLEFLNMQKALKKFKQEDSIALVKLK